MADRGFVRHAFEYGNHRAQQEGQESAVYKSWIARVPKGLVPKCVVCKVPVLRKDLKKAAKVDKERYKEDIRKWSIGETHRRPITPDTKKAEDLETIAANMENMVKVNHLTMIFKALLNESKRARHPGLSGELNIPEEVKHLFALSRAFYICVHNPHGSIDGTNLCNGVLHYRCRLQTQGYSIGDFAKLAAPIQEFVGPETDVISNPDCGPITCTGLPGLKVETPTARASSMYITGRYPTDKSGQLMPHRRADPALPDMDMDVWISEHEDNERGRICVYCGESVLDLVSEARVAEMKEITRAKCVPDQVAAARMFFENLPGEDESLLDGIQAQWEEDLESSKADPDVAEKYPRYHRLLEEHEQRKDEGMVWLKFDICNTEIAYPTIEQLRNPSSKPFEQAFASDYKTPRGACGAAYHQICSIPDYKILGTNTPAEPHFFCLGPGNAREAPFDATKVRQELKKQVLGIAGEDGYSKVKWLIEEELLPSDKKLLAKQRMNQGGRYIHTV
ncbi:hypothetical protein BJ508DRAFT_24554 [Ascobolus immersus RN42]|uniref:Uncharacterized protein n=1 Tax=Ascobolus immersus RN42 TaxID=1160509 RepID=A0A3N4HSS7_ASCIM|nr:hypothetical protein BJ508DRAFT_24554 [Ascobolus immersus RN42]